MPPEEGGRCLLDAPGGADTHISLGPSSGTFVQAFSPEAVRPFPKAGPRKDTKRRGKRR